MNDVFPEICGSPLGEVPAGSIATIPHHDGRLMALVTDQSVQTDLRSIVILNLPQHDPSSFSVEFHENWGKRDPCLYYRTPLRFEISNKVDDISTNATWWRIPGVIASLHGEFFIRALGTNRGGFQYVNVRTGAIFTHDLPNFFIIFGVWSIWLRDPLRECSGKLFDFDIHSRAPKQT
jgi:hypothetical protein